MKRPLLSIALMAISIILASWGSKGHRAVATIAQKHLTPDAAMAVKVYLKGESMTDAST